MVYFLVQIASLDAVPHPENGLELVKMTITGFQRGHKFYNNFIGGNRFILNAVIAWCIFFVQTACLEAVPHPENGLNLVKMTTTAYQILLNPSKAWCHSDSTT